MRIGIIGFGGAGMAHRHYFSCVEGCKVVAVLETGDEGRARAAKADPSLKVTADFDEFAREIDAVSVCTPDETHADYIVAALNRGLHVLCEKPLTDSVDGVRRILEAESRSGKVLAVLHQMRFVPLFSKVHSIVRTGALGTMNYLEGYYVHDLRERAFAYDDWRASGHATPMVYAGCHFVDLLRWFAGEEIVEVYAAANHLAFPRYPESDLNIATLRFASGVLGKVLVSFASACSQDHSIRLYGSEASIDNNALFEQGRWKRAIHTPTVIQREIFRRDRVEVKRLYLHLKNNFPALLLHYMFQASRRIVPRSNSQYEVRHYPMRLYEHASACAYAVRDFVDAVCDGKKPLCSGAESASAVLACLAAVESHRTNRPVPVQALASVA
jgi:predicted dehydrogenase